MNVTTLDRRQPGEIHRPQPGDGDGAMARCVVSEWRRLTHGGSPTLVACSGGADSTALAITLAQAGAAVTLGHVAHDLRAQAEAERDRDAARELARRLGAPCIERCVQVGSGNAEAAARSLRYDALASMAAEAGLAFVATGHHADDQFESIVMALLRGAGLAGLAGAAPSRPLSQDVTLVRPMLNLTHDDAMAICAGAGAHWVEDATNRDGRRFRSSLRHGPLRAMARLRPGASRRASRTAELLRDAAGLVQDRAGQVFGVETRWDRRALRQERAIVIGEGLRMAARRLTANQGADRLDRARVDPVVEMIRSTSGERKIFDWPGGVTIIVERDRVSMLLKERQER